MHKVLTIQRRDGDVEQIKYRKDNGDAVYYSVCRQPSPDFEVEMQKVTGTFTRTELNKIETLIKELPFVDSVRST